MRVPLVAAPSHGRAAGHCLCGRASAGSAGSLPLLAALARLPFLVAAALWSVVIAAAVITILLGSFALAGGRPSLANLVGLVALCIGFTPLISGISLGQEVLPALAGVIAALWLGRRRGGWSSGVVTLFCGFKATIAALLVPLRSPDHVLAGRTSAWLHRARTSRGQRGLASSESTASNA